MNQPESLSQPLTQTQFVSTFRLFSRFSFWIQLFFGAVSGIVLLFAMLGRNMSEQTNNAGIGFGVFLASVGCALEFTGIFAIGF